MFGKQVLVADIFCDEQQSADSLCRKVCCVSIFSKLYCICVIIKLIILLFTQLTDDHIVCFFDHLECFSSLCYFFRGKPVLVED